MTVVNPKSISGINSITTGSGSDNLLTIHTSDASSTERVRINSSGDVIVGSGITVSPDGDIFTTGVTTSTTFVGSLTGDVTGAASQITVADESSDTDAFLVFTNTATGNNAPKTGTNLTFNSSNGSLGVGGAVNLTDTSTGTGTNGGIYRHSNGYTYYQPKSDGNGGVLSNGDGTATWRTHSPGGSNGYLTAEVGNGTQRLLLDSNGYLGLHMTDPHLYYSKTLVVGAETEGDGGGITIKGASTHTNYLMFADSNSGTARYDGYIGYSHNARELYLAAAASARATIDSSGNLEIGNGNLVIGTSGKGIDFSATANGGTTTPSELLDDYEEGSWQPQIGGNNMITNHAHYTKIGNFVHLDFDMVGTASANGNTITGLPFTAVEYSAFHFGWVSDTSQGSQNTTSLQGGLLSSGGFTMRTAGGNVNLNVANGQRVIGTAQYRTSQTIRYVYKLKRLNLF